MILLAVDPPTACALRCVGVAWCCWAHTPGDRERSLGCRGARSLGFHSRRLLRRARACGRRAAARTDRSRSIATATCTGWASSQRALLPVEPHDRRRGASVQQPAVALIVPERRSAIDGRTTRHPGYAIGQQKRKLVEQGFGWMKTIGGLRKLRHRGGPLVQWTFTLTAAAHNIVRMRRLLTPAAV